MATADAPGRLQLAFALSASPMVSFSDSFTV
jgi:hypothetical protein